MNLNIATRNDPRGCSNDLITKQFRYAFVSYLEMSSLSYKCIARLSNYTTYLARISAIFQFRSKCIAHKSLRRESTARLGVLVSTHVTRRSIRAATDDRFMSLSWGGVRNRFDVRQDWKEAARLHRVVYTPSCSLGGTTVVAAAE